MRDIEAHGLSLLWARDIKAAVDLLGSSRDKTAIVTDLALADGNWSDLAQRVRSMNHPASIVLVTSFGTAELWWDALECGVDDIVPAHLLGARVRQLIEAQGG